MKKQGKISLRKGLLVSLCGIFLFGSQLVMAGVISYDISFFRTDFTKISAYSGGFKYDDGTQFVSDFNLNLGIFGNTSLGFSVPAGALALGTPPGISFNPPLFAALSGGNGTLCSQGCNAVFNQTNVFALLSNSFGSIASSSPQSDPSDGFYQILPSAAVPETPAGLLLLTGMLALFGVKKRNLRNST